MSSNYLSITKVKLAFECPRLLYLAHHFGGPSLFRPPIKNYPGSVVVNFHRLADRAIDYILREPKLTRLLQETEKPIDNGKINLIFQEEINQNVFLPQLQNSENLNSINYLRQGLNQLIGRWTELILQNMETCPPQKVIRKTFIAKEYKLSHTFLLPDGKEQAIKGTLDSLIFDFKRHRLCVVEYKTYHPVDPTAQLVQAALYSYVLHKNLSVPVDVKVFCVLPQFKEYYYSWQELEKSIYRLIPHKLGQIQQWLSWQPGEASAPPPTSGPDLCSRCPQEKRCREFFP